MDLPRLLLAACGVMALLVMIFFVVYIDVDTPFIIISGSSMTPTLYPGDLVLIKREHVSEIAVGDIIAFLALNDGDSQQNDGKRMIVHRVVEITVDENNNVFLTTRGDFNQNNDDELITESSYVGKMYLVIPKLGNVMNLVKNPVILALIILVTFLIYFYDIRYRRIGYLTSRGVAGGDTSDKKQ